MGMGTGLRLSYPCNTVPLPVGLRVSVSVIFDFIDVYKGSQVAVYMF
jgi:hypothetical protein